MDVVVTHRHTRWWGGGSRPSPEKIKQISFFVFRGWRDLGKNKSHDFYLYITYSSG